MSFYSFTIEGNSLDYNINNKQNYYLNIKDFNTIYKSSIKKLSNFEYSSQVISNRKNTLNNLSQIKSVEYLCQST